MRSLAITAAACCVVLLTVLLGGCGGGHSGARTGSGSTGTDTGTAQVTLPTTPAKAAVTNVYSHAGPGDLSSAVVGDPALVYVPNSMSNTVTVISQRTFKVIRTFPVGALPQHVTPAWNLRTLYVDDDLGNSLTPINPRTGDPGQPIPVEDPYNLYFTPDGKYAIVVAERLQRLDFRNPTTFRMVHSLHVPQCAGVDHMDFSADGRYAFASCEFAGRMIKVDLQTQRVVSTLTLGNGHTAPQDVKLSPNGKIVYVADMNSGGVWEIDPVSFRVTGFIRTGAGAHGLYPSRNAQQLYVSNRTAGTISVISFRTNRVIATWTIPPPASPDMGGVSANGKTLWLSGRYNAEVYAINTSNGHLRARIPVGQGPHGLCVWPQPGRYSLGHTGITR